MNLCHAITDNTTIKAMPKLVVQYSDSPDVVDIGPPIVFLQP